MKCAHEHGGTLQMRAPIRRSKLVDETYLVTIVLTGSSMPVGVMMNQNNMLTMLTTQIAPYRFRPSRSISFQYERGLIESERRERLTARANCATGSGCQFEFMIGTR